MPQALALLGTVPPVLDAAIERLLLTTGSSTLNAQEQPWLTQDNLRAFMDLLHRKQVTAVFQPILDFQSRGYLGFEGLIRGPAGTPLHTPQVLFGLAAQAGLTLEFERLCRETVLRAFARQSLPGRLFLNVSVPCLADREFLGGGTSRLLESLGLRTSQIVIELTENHQVADFAALREVLDRYRQSGYQIAIDDLGEGFSNLRIWSEIRPEFIKIDRHFISGIADDALKFQLVRAMQQIAETCHVRLIAEGIETEAEFATVRDLGILHGQGYLIARPQASPSAGPSEDVRRLFARGGVIVFPRAVGIATATVRRLLQDVTPARPGEDNDSVFRRFEREQELMVVPVVAENGHPLGLINRHNMLNHFARPYRRELHGRKPCTQFMNAAPIVVDQATSIQALGQLLSRSPQHQLLDGFIVTEEDRYQGIGSSQALMALITDMQITAARYANPLTQLPGNVPINEHIDRLLDSGATFTACYCDLDHFKPFNDAYGYDRGDEMIRLLGGILTRVSHPHLDFVGHIGGDDFMLLMQSSDWENRLRAALWRFDGGLAAVMDPAHLSQGGYAGEDRRGHSVFHALPALSIGCLPVAPGIFHSHHEVSAAVTEAKKQAKKTPGSCLFVERRKGGLTVPDQAPPMAVLTAAATASA